jgi:hypothetical protein
LDRVYGLKFNQKACSMILLYFEYGSPLRWSNGSIVITIDSSIISKGSLLGPQNARNSLCISIKPREWPA